MLNYIPAYWMNHSNFGDALTPYLIEKITGKKAVWTDNHTLPKYMVTGSILNEPVADTCVVWGTGLAWADVYVRNPLEICAVRGPLTRKSLVDGGLDCPETFGDPCLLLPRFYTGKALPMSYKLGIIPHFIDYIEVSERYKNNPDVLVVDLLSGIEQVVDMVLSCDVFISSSLHGIIVAHAYGKSCGYVTFSDKIIGDGTKYKDYLLSVGHELYSPLDYSVEEYSTQQLIDWIPKQKEINLNLDKLLESCPFRV